MISVLRSLNRCWVGELKEFAITSCCLRNARRIPLCLANALAAEDSKGVLTPFDFLGENMFNCFCLGGAQHVSVMSFVGA